MIKPCFIKLKVSLHLFATKAYSNTSVKKYDVDVQEYSCSDRSRTRNFNEKEMLTQFMSPSEMKKTFIASSRLIWN